MTDVWLDTSIVLAWNPRFEGVGAQSLLRYAQNFGHRVFLPELVLHELTKHYSDDAAKCLKELDRLSPPSVAIERQEQPANLEDFYRSLLQRRCEEESITIVRLPTELQGRLVGRLLQMGINHVPPFQSKGARVYKDVLILLSVLNYAEENKQRHLAFIAADKGFKRQSICDLSNEYSVNLVLYESVDDFIKDQNKQLLEEQQARMQQQAQRVREFLLGDRGRIEHFIRENARNEWLLPLGLARGLLLYQIQNIALKDISDPIVVEKDHPEEGIATLLITFDALLEIEIGSLKTWVAGEVYAPKELEQMVHGFGWPPEPLTRWAALICEAIATEDATGELTTFQMKAVRTKTSTSTTERLGVGLSDRAIIEKIEGQLPPRAD